MELFDLVDENDQVIGETDKETSHKNGLIHRIVSVFVFGKDGRLFVQEHIKSGNKLDHTVGGHVKQGESYDDAAHREAEEEIGLVELLSKISVFYSGETWGGSNVRHMIGLYECIPLNWNFSENEEVKNLIPMEINDIVEMMNKEPKRFTGGFKNTMFEYIKQKGLSLNLSNYNI